MVRETLRYNVVGVLDVWPSLYCSAPYVLGVADLRTIKWPVTSETRGVHSGLLNIARKFRPMCYLFFRDNGERTRRPNTRARLGSWICRTSCENHSLDCWWGSDSSKAEGGKMFMFDVNKVEIVRFGGVQTCAYIARNLALLWLSKTHREWCWRLFPAKWLPLAWGPCSLARTSWLQRQFRYHTRTGTHLKCQFKPVGSTTIRGFL